MKGKPYFHDLDEGFGGQQKERGKQITKKRNELDVLKIEQKAGLSEYKRKMLKHGYVSLDGIRTGGWHGNLPQEMEHSHAEFLEVYDKLKLAHSEAMQDLYDFYGTEEFNKFCEELHAKFPQVADSLRVSAHGYSGYSRTTFDRLSRK